jgi:hypothetical protein
LSAAVASATTVAIGYAAMAWFAQGERPTRESLQQTVAGVTDYLKDQLMGLGEKKPDRGTLRERITQALNGLPGQLRPGLRTSDDENGVDSGGRDDEYA